MEQSAVRILLVTTFSIGLLLASGCTWGPRRYEVGSLARYHRADESLREETPIVRGEPRPVIDTVGWITGIPGKIILWNRKIENHAISSDTEEAIAAYLAVNELEGVKVRLNQYDPLDDWRRLTKNHAVAAPWRYTLGTLHCLGETIVPGRLFGGDHFNPFTNTVHLYSDVPAVALHEAGHAKDWAHRKYKGTYAAAYAFIPGAPLWHERIATRDVIDYLAEYGTIEQQREAYNVLLPAYGTYVGRTVEGLASVPYGVVTIPAVVGGHMVGRIKSGRLHEIPRAEPLPHVEGEIEQVAYMEAEGPSPRIHEPYELPKLND